MRSLFFCQIGPIGDGGPRALARRLASVTAPIGLARFTGGALVVQKAPRAAVRVVKKWLTTRETGNIALDKNLRI